MKRTLNITREIARIAGTLIFAGGGVFVYRILIGHGSETPVPSEIKMLLFPVALLMAGALSAWKWPAAGGIALVVGFGLLLFLGGWPDRSPQSLSEWTIVLYILLLPVTGLLHLLAWRLDHR